MSLDSKIIYLVIDLILPLAFGYSSQIYNRNGKRFWNWVISLGNYVLYPILSMLSFWTLQLNFDLIWLPFIGVAANIIPGVIGYLRIKKLPDPHDKGAYLLSAILSNTFTLGGLSVFILFGETGYAYTQLMVLFSNITLFVFCYPLAQYYHDQGNRNRNEPVSLTAIFFNRNQLPTLGVILGLLLNVAGIARPDAITLMVDPLVHLGAWAALAPIGFSIDVTGIRRYWRCILDLIPNKFLATPLITYLLAGLVIDDATILKTIIVLASTPTAMGAVITVKVHQLNLDISMAAFLATTAVYLLLVYPILYLALR